VPLNSQNMYEIIGKITVLLICCFLVFLFFYCVYKVIDNRIKKEKELRNFQNKLIDKDLQKEWVRFLETGKIGRID